MTFHVSQLHTSFIPLLENSISVEVLDKDEKRIAEIVFTGFELTETQALELTKSVVNRVNSK
jgi:hypothetical protein